MLFLFKKVLLFVPFVNFFISTCISFSVTGLSTSRQLSYPFQQRCRDRTISTPTLLRALEENNEDSDCGNENDDYDRKIFERNIVDLATDQKEMIKELEWRSNKVALEEANTRAFQKRLKSRPWKLPYDDAVSFFIVFEKILTTNESQMCCVFNICTSTEKVGSSKSRG